MFYRGMMRQAGCHSKRKVDGRLLHINTRSPLDHVRNAVPAIAGAHFKHGDAVGRDNGIEVEWPAAISQGDTYGLDLLDYTLLVGLRDIGRQTVPGNHKASQMLVGDGDEGNTSVDEYCIAADFGPRNKLLHTDDL